MPGTAKGLGSGHLLLATGWRAARTGKWQMSDWLIPMIIDCHVHICSATPGHGSMSQSLLDSLPFRFMRWRLGLGKFGPETERQLEELLPRTIAETTRLDAAVVLA